MPSESRLDAASSFSAAVICSTLQHGKIIRSILNTSLFFSFSASEFALNTMDPRLGREREKQERLSEQHGERGWREDGASVIFTVTA